MRLIKTEKDVTGRWARLRAIGIGLAMLGLLAGPAASAAEKMIQVPESVWKEVLANQENMRKELEDLRGKVDQQGQQVETIRGQQGDLDKKIDTVSKEIPDADKLVKNGRPRVELVISGHVNKGVLFADTGDGPGVTDDGSNDGDRDRGIFVVDNDASSTRLKFEGKANLDDKNSFGAVIEVQFESNSTQDVNQRDEGDSAKNKDNFTKRKLEVYWKNKDYGNVWVGQGDTASNGTTEKDLSGATVISKSEIETVAGGLSFRMPDGSITMTEIKDVFDNLDGASRQERVRYDTPSFGGANLSASFINGGDFDVAVHHARQYDVLGGTKVAAGGHYYNAKANSDADGFEQAGGSLSVLHVPTGLNVTAAGGQRWYEEGSSKTDRGFIYAKGGWIAELFDIGTTAFAADYQYVWDSVAEGDEGHVYGAFVVQNIEKTATEVYAGMRYHQYWSPAEDFQDILAFLFGARQRF